MGREKYKASVSLETDATGNTLGNSYLALAATSFFLRLV